VASTTVGGET